MARLFAGGCTFRTRNRVKPWPIPAPVRFVTAG